MGLCSHSKGAPKDAACGADVVSKYHINVAAGDADTCVERDLPRVCFSEARQDFPKAAATCGRQVHAV